MSYPKLLIILSLFVAPTLMAKSTQPQAFADPPDDIAIIQQIKQQKQHNKDFYAKNNDELRHTWQLFLMSDHHYQSYNQRPVYYFNPPILLRFDDHRFHITQGCQSLTGDYRLSAMDMGFIITDNITLRHNPCPISPTAIHHTSEHIGFGELIPITINGNSENVLIFDGESSVLIFRRSAL